VLLFNQLSDVCHNIIFDPFILLLLLLLFYLLKNDNKKNEKMMMKKQIKKMKNKLKFWLRAT